MVKGMCCACMKWRELENYGEFKLCHECVQLHVNPIYPPKPKKHLGLEIHPSDFLKNGHYQPTNIVVCSNKENEDLGTLIKVISHESIHYAIHMTEGVQTTFQFDNIFWMCIFQSLKEEVYDGCVPSL